MLIIPRMQARNLKVADRSSWVLVFDEDDEVISGLTSFARSKGLQAGSFQAIGAFRQATLGYFDWERKEYAHIPVREQVEVVSLLGDVSSGKEGPVVHAHVVLGRRDGSALAGHLLDGRVRPTLELVLTTSPSVLARRHDERSGLALIDPDLARPARRSERKSRASRARRDRASTRGKRSASAHGTAD